jgi:hypothetical protein
MTALRTAEGRPTARGRRSNLLTAAMLLFLLYALFPLF